MVSPAISVSDLSDIEIAVRETLPSTYFTDYSKLRRRGKIDIVLSEDMV